MVVPWCSSHQEAKTQVVQAARDPDLQLTAASVPWVFSGDFFW